MAAFTLTQGGEAQQQEEEGDEQQQQQQQRLSRLFHPEYVVPLFV